MSSEGGDALRIPIEIKTDDLEEIQSLLNDLDKAESEIDVLKPRKGKGTGDETSRSAFAREEPFDDRGGAFGGQTREALPTQGRDKTSRAALQRENEFSKMRDQVEEMGQTQGNVVGQLVNLGFLTSPNIAGYANSAGAAAAPASSMVKGGMKGGLLGSMGMSGLSGIIGKAGIYGMIIMGVMEIVNTAIDFMFRPGGAMDKRFKREMGKEDVKMMDLSQKSDINQGRRIVRVTSSSNLRGTDSQVRSSLDVYKSGQRIFDMDGSFMVKNTGVGTI